MKHLLLFLCMLTMGLQAETLEIEYSSFYSHIKKLSSESPQVLQFAFGFKKVQSSNLCHLQSVTIHTQKVDIPVIVTDQQRFVLPDEKALKMAQAIVVVDLQEAANQCDMSVQLETKTEYLKTTYSQQELIMLLSQYQLFFDDMGGFLSFLMPSAKGLLIEFSQSHEIPVAGLAAEDWVEGKLLLREEWISASSGLELQLKPLRITPWVGK